MLGMLLSILSSQAVWVQTFGCWGYAIVGVNPGMVGIQFSISQGCFLFGSDVHCIPTDILDKGVGT